MCTLSSEDLPDSTNIDLIESSLYLGNLTSAVDKPTLSHFRISHILTVDSKPLPDDILSLKGLHFHYVQVDDMAHEDLLSHFEDCYKFIQDGQLKGNVLVHCFFGVSRSATIVASFLMKKYKISLDVALERIKERRRCVGPNSGFLSQLTLYQDMKFALNDQQPQYKLYRNSVAAKYFIKYGKRFPQETFLDILYPDPSECLKDDDYIVYKCKSCRRPLITNMSVCPHHSIETDGNSPSNMQQCYKGTFVCPLSWMIPMFDAVEGKLFCPKCKSKIGSYDWKKFKTCPCGKKVTAGCLLVPSKIDNVASLS